MTDDPFLAHVIKRVRDFDAARPRSTQAAVGWSELGGCRSHLGYRLDGAWATDEPDTWAAQRGTAIHEYLQGILVQAGMRIEVVTSYRGVPGHADLVVDGSDVTDIKSTRLANVRLWQRDPAILWEKRVQTQGYAAALVDESKLPPDATVRLLVVPVDGTYADWWSHREPFDRSIADWGIGRVLAEVEQARAEGRPLPKDKPYAWCRDYCEFFTLCRGEDDEGAPEKITDPEMAAAIAAYGEATAQETALGKEKDRLALMIRGLRGTTDDWRITLSKPGASRNVLDEEWVRADYAARGEDVPERSAPGARAGLRVTRIKKAGAKT